MHTVHPPIIAERVIRVGVVYMSAMTVDMMVQFLINSILAFNATDKL